MVADNDTETGGAEGLMGGGAVKTPIAESVILVFLGSKTGALFSMVWYGGEISKSN